VEFESTSGWQATSATPPMIASPDDVSFQRCPCGAESLGAHAGQHVLGPTCRALVVGHVGRSCGARFAHDVEDIVQDCYRKLWSPGGLDHFRPPPDRPRARAFRAWLYQVVWNHCANWRGYVRRRPDLHRHGNPTPPDDASDAEAGLLGRLFDPAHTPTQEEEWALNWLRSIAGSAVADARARWSRRPKSARRFDVILPVALKLEGTYALAAAQLGIKENHARQLGDVLRKALRKAVRARVQDELFLEPALSQKSIDAKIDEAIQEHFEAACPGGHALPLDFFMPEQESRS
jgi:hypothetical protein